MKSKYPLVTVGVLSYNREKTLPEALDSILDQTYPNIEVIISDDFSNDKSSMICKEYCKKSKRIKIFIQSRNLGIVKNSNLLLKKAHGKYFMWASNDDTWDKDFVTILVNMLEENKQSVLAMSNMILTNGKIRQYSNLNFRPIEKRYDILKKYLSFSSLLVWGIFRTKILRKAGGFHEDSRPLYGGSDNLTVWKALLKGDFVFSSRSLFFKRDSGNGIDPYINFRNISGVKKSAKKIKRYLFFPIMFLYDEVWFLYYTCLSDLKIDKKIILTLYCLFYYLRVNLHYFYTILKGVCILSKSLLKNKLKI